MLYNHIDAIGDHSLPDYVINVVGKNIKYVIVVPLSPPSYNLVGPIATLKKVLNFEGNPISRS